MHVDAPDAPPQCLFICTSSSFEASCRANCLFRLQCLYAHLQTVIITGWRSSEWCKELISLQHAKGIMLLWHIHINTLHAMHRPSHYSDLITQISTFSCFPYGTSLFLSLSTQYQSDMYMSILFHRQFNRAQLMCSRFKIYIWENLKKDIIGTIK